MLKSLFRRWWPLLAGAAQGLALALLMMWLAR